MLSFAARHSNEIDPWSHMSLFLFWFQPPRVKHVFRCRSNRQSLTFYCLLTKNWVRLSSLDHQGLQCQLRPRVKPLKESGVRNACSWVTVVVVDVVVVVDAVDTRERLRYLLTGLPVVFSVGYGAVSRMVEGSLGMTLAVGLNLCWHWIWKKKLEYKSFELIF